MKLCVLKQIYSKMLKIRLVEETIANKYSEQKMRCPTHLSIGQEAVPAVAGVLLKKTDLCVSGHRAHAHYLGKGGDLKQMIAELYGKDSGCSRGRGGSMHLIDKSVGFYGSTAIVGGTIPVGVGLALSQKIAKENSISCVFLGDGATEEGSFYESVNFAVLKKLPVLFICENNLYSVYSSLAVRQPEGREIYKMVESMGCESYKSDGNDTKEVFKVLSNAINKIRNGKGPIFIELLTYRFREHCGPNYDNNLGYRTIEEFEFWENRDPLVLIKNLMNNVESEFFTAEKERIIKEINEAFLFAEKSEFPKAESLFNYIYSTKNIHE